jgi:hypothetical protein
MMMIKEVTGKGSRHASVTSFSSDFNTKDTHPRVFLPVTQFLQMDERRRGEGTMRGEGMLF